MTQFVEGQEVEVLAKRASAVSYEVGWFRAKIIHALSDKENIYHVQFRDGDRDDFDATHIRVAPTDAEITAYIKKIGDQDKSDCIE
jgi:hypothetical protein